MLVTQFPKKQYRGRDQDSAREEREKREGGTRYGHSKTFADISKEPAGMLAPSIPPKFLGLCEGHITAAAAALARCCTPFGRPILARSAHSRPKAAAAAFYDSFSQLTAKTVEDDRERGRGANCRAQR